MKTQIAKSKIILETKGNTKRINRPGIIGMLLALISLPAIGQDSVYGKWYMFSRNRMIEMDFQVNRMVSRQLNWDLTDRNRSQPDTQLIWNIQTANGNIYYCVPDPRSKDGMHVNSLKMVRPGREILIALNGPDSLFTSLEAATQFIRTDTGKKFGMPLFSETEIRAFRSQKKVKDMTAADFNTYAAHVIKSKHLIDSWQHLPVPSNGLLYYGYAVIRIALAETGYDPFVTTDQFDQLILRFKNNPETKASVSKMFEEN